MGSDTWYWTAERVAALRRVIETAVVREGDKFYIVGSMGLRRYITENAARLGFDVPAWQIPNGMALLVYFGVLAKSQVGRRSASYRRRYDPNRRISREAIAHYRQLTRQQRIDGWP